MDGQDEFAKRKKLVGYEWIKLRLKRLRRSNLWTVGSYILVGLVGRFFFPFLEEAVTKWSKEWLGAKHLSCEILSILTLQKTELPDIAQRENLASFRLHLDDPILEKYQLVKIRLKNGSEPIDGHLSFVAEVGVPYTKIIDFQYKVVSPPNKAIKVENSLLPLRWQMTEENRPTEITLPPYADLPSISGFHVYRSLVKDAGYGRLNEMLLTDVRIGLSPQLRNSYYRVTVLSSNGYESELGTVMAIPDHLALEPFFVDAYWIDPNSKTDRVPDGSRKRPFPNLEAAFNKIGNSGKFLVMSKRSEIEGSLNPRKEGTVFYEDELAFLRGTLQVRFPTGMDGNSQIDLFLLTKPADSRLESNVSVRLEGAPGITLLTRGEKVQAIGLDEVAKEEIVVSPKLTLTPLVVKTVLLDNAIVLAWPRPSSAQYKGVKIFRSSRRDDPYDLENFGAELYDGPGLAGTITCELFQRAALQEDPFLSRINDMISLQFSEPPRGDRPAAPTGIKVSSNVELDQPYFVDRAVTPKDTYTYTLFGYDNYRKYSYPITVNASLRDKSSADQCVLPVEH